MERMTENGLGSAVPQESAQRRGFSRRSLFLFAAFLLLALLVTPVIFRVHLLEYALSRVLERQGFHQPRMNVASFDLNSVSLADFRLGSEEQIFIQKLELEFDHGKLFEAPLRRLNIIGLTVKLDLDQEFWGLPYSLTAQRQDAQGKQETLPDLRRFPLPEETLVDGRFEIATPEELLLGTFDGRLDALQGEWPQGAFQLKSETVVGAPGATFLVAVQSKGSQASAQVQLNDSFAGKSMGVEARFELEELFEAAVQAREPDFSLESLRAFSQIDISLQEAATPYGSLDLVLPLMIKLEAGTLTLKDRGSGQMGFKPLSGLLPDEMATALARGRNDSRLEAQPFAEVSLPIASCLDGLGHPCSINSQLGLMFAVGDEDPAEIRLRNDTKVTFAQAAGPSYHSESLSLWLSDLPLGLARIETLLLTGDFQGDLAKISGNFQTEAAITQLSLGPGSAERLQVRIAGSFQATNDRSNIAIGGVELPQNTLELKGLRFGSALNAEGPIRIGVSAAQLSRTQSPEIRPDLDFRLAADGGAAKYLVTRQGKEPIELAMSPIALSLSGSWRKEALQDLLAEISLSDLQVSPHELDLGNLVLEAHQNSAAQELQLKYEAVVFDRQQKNKRFFPLALRGDGRLANDKLTFDGYLQPKGKGDQFASFSGYHELEAASGELKLSSNLPDFKTDGLQPAALSPLLSDLEDVTGKATGGLQLAWRRDAMTGSFALGLEDFSLRSADVLLRNLDLQLLIDDIFAPHAKVGQKITFEKVLVPLPIEDFSMTFGLEPGDPAKIAIEGLRFHVMDGEVSLGKTLMDFSVARQKLLFSITGLGLPQIASELAIKGLEAEGILSGRFPVVIDRDGNFRIVEAQLTSAAPGKIRFSSATAAAYLAQAGESAELLLQALENFHYQELSLTLDKTEQQDTRLGISLKGRNPDLLEGREFNLNINVDTNLGSVFSAIADAYKLSNRLLFHAWTLGR